MNPAQLVLIRTAVNKGLALGDERFRREIQQLTGLRVIVHKAGRTPSADDVPADPWELLL